MKYPFTYMGQMTKCISVVFLDSLWHQTVLFDGCGGATIECADPYSLSLSPQLLILCKGEKWKTRYGVSGRALFHRASLVEFATVTWPTPEGVLHAFV